MMNDEGGRVSWNSRVGFLLAAIGSAVGLGNIWRFPYVCYKNGGGAFLVPYLVAFFMIGIPIMMAEQALGHKLRGAFPLVCRRISKRWEVLGWWAVVYSAFGILLYYNVVLAWCLNYLKFALNLEWGENTEAFFYTSFLGLSKAPFELGGIQWPIVMTTLLMWVFVWLAVARGIRRGIELANDICIPLLFLQMVILVVWSFFLPGAAEGIRAYLTPDITKLADPSVWSSAFSHMFFTLSIGFGVMVAYASYLPKRASIASNSVITCVTNCSFEVFAGFAVFSTIGYMALASGISVNEAASSGPGLAFITYPKAISLLPFGQRIFGILFFSALLLAGFTSSISLLETFVSATLDKFDISRERLVAICCVIGFLGSLIFTTGGGLFWLDIVDHFLNNFALLLVGFLEAILIGWVFGAHRVADHIRENGGFTLGAVWQVVVRYITPLLIIILLTAETWNKLQKPYGGYSWVAVGTIGIGSLILTFSIAVLLAKRRWKETSVEEVRSA